MVVVVVFGCGGWVVVVLYLLVGATEGLMRRSCRRLLDGLAPPVAAARARAPLALRRKPRFL